MEKKKEKKSKPKSQNTLHPPAFKAAAAERMEKGENLARLSRELQVTRSVLYRWRDTFRRAGVAGFRGPGRPKRRVTAAEQSSTRRPAERRVEQNKDQRIAELERKVGRQALQIDFLKRAFKRVEELRQKSTGAGGTASTERSGE